MSELCSKGSGSLSAGALLLQRGMCPGFSLALVVEARGRSDRLWLSPIAEQKRAELTDDFSRQIKLYRPRGLNPMVDQREELPLLPFGNPIGFVPAASRGVTQ